MHHALSRTVLRRRIGEPDFSRGETYFARSRVKSAKLGDSARRVTGQVLGNQQRLYSQDIALDWDGTGGLKRLTGNCSCPVGHNCKHVAAVMLALLPDLSAVNPVAQANGANGHHSPEPNGSVQAAGLIKTKPAAQRLYYVLRDTASGALEIEALKVRILKNGGLSKNPQRYSLSSHMPGCNADFLRAADDAVLGKLQRLKRLGIEAISGLRIHASDVLGDTLHDLVHEIIATGRAKPFSIGHPDLVWAEPLRCKFQWQELPDGTQKLITTGPMGQEFGSLPLIPPLYVDPRNGQCGEIRTDATPELTHALVTMPPVPPKAARNIVKALTRAKPDTSQPRKGEVAVREDVIPVPILRLFAVDGQFGIPGVQRQYFGVSEAQEVTVPILRLSFDYDGHHAGFHHTADPEYREGGKLISIRRNSVLEAQALARIRTLEDYGISEIGALEQELYGLKKRRPHDFMVEVETENHLAHELDYIALDFMRESVPELEAEGWRVEIDDSWPYRFFDGPLDIQAEVERNRTDWFSFALTAYAGDQELDLLPVVLRILETLPLDAMGQLPEDYELDVFLEDVTHFLDLADGRRAPVDGRKLAPLVRACLAAHTLLGGFHSGEAIEARRLAEALEGSGVQWRGSDELLELGQKLQALGDVTEIPPPPSLKGDLRHYQKAGYGWLKALRETGFGGVLADDMGLGKTIQALALLCHCHLEEQAGRPSLLVVPTSLIGNWEREAQRFAPDLKLLILHGPSRQRHFASIPDSDLIITTYPLLHRDHTALFAQEYELAILDEAQAVKNPTAASTKRIREIKARQRLALTGTPIENNLEELWAIYDWTMPGLLGDRKTFRNTFRTAIENHGDDAARLKLASRIRPFLLRRTKEEVATDLPPKTEINEFIPLYGEQGELYETIRVAMDARVRDAITSRGLNATRITVLDALLKMRQVCCDPALVKIDAAAGVKESAKRERLMEMLDELLAEGRKVLVFSQFVEMLRLIEQDVSARGIDYAMLTGQTKDRAGQIERFQEGDASIFLISLKAGGVGLNLTAADTVIIYDPWWNPAVERQAMDRAHRIGQDKPVFVYKLIAEGSVEAAILNMQSRKQALTDGLFEGTRGGGIGMHEADIQELFAPLS